MAADTGATLLYGARLIHDREHLPEDEVEKLVVEAMRVGAGFDEVQQAVKDTWTDLRGLKAVGNDR